MNPQLILDRLTAWVEKQSSVGPAAFRQALVEIWRDVEREQRGRLDSDIAIQHEAFETAKRMLTANPALREKLWRWLNETAVDHVRAIGEYGRVPEPESLARESEVTAKSDVLRVANWLETIRPIRPSSDELCLMAGRLRGLATAAFGPDDKYVTALAQQMGEFARDELGTTAADVDAAIAADKAAELEEKPALVFNQEDAHEMWRQLNKAATERKEVRALLELAETATTDEVLETMGSRLREEWPDSVREPTEYE
jgi:hypothetical protein